MIHRRGLIAATATVLLATGMWVTPSAPASPGPAPSTTGIVATRALLARQTLVDAHRHPLDGRGTSIAIIDTGIDPAHPAFALPGGGSKVVRELSALPCLIHGEDGPTTYELSSDPGCITPLPAGTNSDAGHGGHGSMIGGIIAGDSYVLPDGTPVGGVAPGARLVVISTTTALVGIQNAFAWVLAHHAAPCGPGVAAAACPPIRVVNCSWGANDPTIVHLQDQLTRVGVVVVWANGNTGGDGTTNNSNQDATLDPTLGVLAVADYNDLQTGTRNGQLESTSSRGLASNPATWPDLSAPGVDIVSSCRPYDPICPAIQTEPAQSGPGPNDVDTYFTGSGTSFSAPEVDGIVAMLFQVDPRASAAQIERTLEGTAYRFRFGAPYRSVGGEVTSYDKGAGLVDAYAAALALGARHR